MGHRGQRGAVRGRPGSVRRAGPPALPSVPDSRYLEPYPYTVNWVCWRAHPLHAPLTRGARNSLVLRFPEHGGERRPEDCGQLS
jgi:hypothetical protein